MSKITETHRQATVRDRRTRWWKEGLVCAAVGAMLGLGVAMAQGWDPLSCASIGGLTYGTLGALFGPTLWPLTLGF
jgi:hypothetical protein